MTTALRITAIPAFSDNYLWLIDDGRQAAVVDPGDAAPVLKTLDQLGLQLTHILITHHHADHTGGIKHLKRETGARIIGPRSRQIAGIDTTVADGDRFNLFDTPAEVIAVPGHTLDHIAYYFPQLLLDEELATVPCLFCGDTLFAGGCGRLFEGTPAQMRSSLEKLQQLPAATRVYCAHEYTLANLAFAEAVEPDNQALQQRINNCKKLRETNQPTVPSTLADELATNPFLRYDQPVVMDAATSRLGRPGSPDEVFGTIRQWKDNF